MNFLISRTDRYLFLTVLMKMHEQKLQWFPFGLHNMPIQLPHPAAALFSLKRVKNNTHTLFLIENSCMWLIQGIRTSPKWHQSRPRRSERRWFFRTEQMLSQWKLRWSESERESDLFSFHLKNQLLLGWKKTLVISEWKHLSVVYGWIMLRDLYVDVPSGWGTFGPVGTGNLFLHAGNQGPNRHVIGQDDQYWTLHAELGDKSSHIIFITLSSHLKSYDF